MLKAVFILVLLLSAYLVSLMWSDKNDHLLTKPNLVLFTVDTLRADHLSIYGYHRKTSPNLASIAKDSFIFDNAYSIATYSAPAHAALLTGLYPSEYGANSNELIIPHQVETLAEILQRHGYVTGAFIGDSVLGETGHFNQGFSTFSLDQVQADTTISVTKEWAERGWKKARAWLEKWFDKNQTKANHQQQPFFLWFHANHPHGNYSPPPQYRNLFIKQAPAQIQSLQAEPTFSLDSLFRKHIEEGKISQDIKDWVVAQYDGEIAFSDYLLGELVDFLKTSGEYENTTIIFVADHGEILFEHWRPGKIRSAGHHANLYYQPVLKIPLLIKPAIVKQHASQASKQPFIRGKRISHLVSSLDIFNTALDLLALPKQNLNTSHSLKPFFLSPDTSNSQALKAEFREQVFFSGQAYDNSCSGLIDNKWHLVRCKMGDQEKQTLFDLDKDPLQLTNVAKQQSEQLKRLDKTLEFWQNNLQQPNQVKKNDLSEQMRKHLEKSGYLDKRENL